MCLGTPYSKKKQDRIRKEAQRRGYIRIYKTVRKCPQTFRAWWDNLAYAAGIQKARALKRFPDDAGWHGFRNYSSAQKWASGSEVIIECLAKADWIIDVGFSKRLYSSVKHPGGKQTIRLKYLCFPKFPNTKVTVKDFKEQYKRWKNGK